MVANADMIRAALERVKDAVQQSIRNERAREPPKMKPAYEDEQDTAMYEEGIKSQYAITEVKKRRGVSNIMNLAAQTGPSASMLTNSP